VVAFVKSNVSLVWWWWCICVSVELCVCRIHVCRQTNG